jgi:hypothetical protein
MDYGYGLWTMDYGLWNFFIASKEPLLCTPSAPQNPNVQARVHFKLQHDDLIIELTRDPAGTEERND